MKYLFFLTFFLSGGNMILVDFSEHSALDNWYIVNDGVMGGLSQGNLYISNDGVGVFEGLVSLENNGGFTSIRHDMETQKIEDKSKAILRVKGDGKRYQFRIKANVNDWYSYIHYFETSGEWENIEIPLNAMYPSFRGRTLDMPNYKSSVISSLTFLIANKKAERFELNIDSIMLE